ncbi:MAG: hypothetical protein ACOCWR_09920 [Oceanidesulfovibrio sp.]
MNTLKILVSFAPWILFWIISAPHSLSWLRIAIIVALVASVIMGVLKLSRGVLLWSGLAYFVAATFFVAYLENMWFIHHLGVLASAALFMGALITMVMGRPFTEDFARQSAPPEAWNTPQFRRGCYMTTAVWLLVFFLNLAMNVWKLMQPDTSGSLLNGLEVVFIASGMLYSNWYSARAKRRKAMVASA